MGFLLSGFAGMVHQIGWARQRDVFAGAKLYHASQCPLGSA